MLLNLSLTAHGYILLCSFFNSLCFQYIHRDKRLTFKEISIRLNFTSLNRNYEKSDFWPWKLGVDLYTSSTYTRVNTVFINDGACDGVFGQFWLTVLLFIKAIILSHFIGMWMTILQITLNYDMEVRCQVLVYCVS